MARDLCTRIDLAESHAETSTVTVSSLNDSPSAGLRIGPRSRQRADDQNTRHS
jgi:hypothetical protein